MAQGHESLREEEFQQIEELGNLKFPLHKDKQIMPQGPAWPAVFLEGAF